MAFSWRDQKYDKKEVHPNFVFINMGETYEYVLEIADRLSRLGSPEGTLNIISVCM